MALIAVGSFALVLAVVVLVHELGHYLAARALGIRVMEFGFGFPPRLLAFRRGETEYSVNLLPFGGFVKLAGENDPSEPRSLARKGVLTRATVLGAGAFMNALLPLVLFSAVFMIPREVLVGRVMIEQVVPNSPAHYADLTPGDFVLKVDGRAVENSGDLGYLVQLRRGAEMNWLVEKRGVQRQVTVIPRWKTPVGQGPVGVVVTTVNPVVEERSYPFWEAIPRGARRSLETLVWFKNEATMWFLGNSKIQLSGPIGIAQVTGEVARIGFPPLLEVTALLSMNLAIMNLLPIPALDGGRLLFVAIEWVRRGRRISPRSEGFVHLVGFVVLITMILVVSYYDIQRIIRGESLLR